MKAKLAELRKAVAAGAGFAAVLVATGVVHGRALEITTAALGLLATLGVYKVTNTKGQ